MKRLTILLAMLPFTAMAQTAPPPTQPDMAALQMALGQQLTETLSAEVQWRARALADEQKIGTLEAELADAKKHSLPSNTSTPTQAQPKP